MTTDTAAPCEVHHYWSQDGSADVCTRCGHRRPWALPDTAALRALVARHDTTLHADHVATLGALCDAADEVERLTGALARTEKDVAVHLLSVREAHQLREAVTRLTAERDAARTAHAALVADLRALTVDDVAKALCAEHDWDAFTEQWESNRDYWRALASVVVARITAVIDRHAGAGS